MFVVLTFGGSAGSYNVEVVYRKQDGSNIYTLGWRKDAVAKADLVAQFNMYLGDTLPSGFRQLLDAG